MARIRTIKPEMPQSESLGRVSREARLLFILLWTICDDAGRTRAASRLLASLLYPYDDDAKDLIPAWLSELEREHCIRLYEVDGTHYLEIPKWLEHQKIDRPSASKFPAPRDEPSKAREASTSPILGKEGTVKEGTGNRARAVSMALELPDDWKPSDEDRSWAAKARPDLTPALLDAETERFRNHAKANNRTAHNWGPNWRNWVSKAPAATPPPRSSTSANAVSTPTLAHDTPEQWRSRLRKYRAGGMWSPAWGPRPESGGCWAPKDILDEWLEAQPKADAA